jgi:hypothetical protein
MNFKDMLASDFVDYLEFMSAFLLFYKDNLKDNAYIIRHSSSSSNWKPSLGERRPGYYTSVMTSNPAILTSDLFIRKTSETAVWFEFDNQAWVNRLNEFKSLLSSVKWNIILLTDIEDSLIIKLTLFGRIINLYLGDEHIKRIGHALDRYDVSSFQTVFDYCSEDPLWIRHKVNTNMEEKHKVQICEGMLVGKYLSLNKYIGE